MGEQVTRSDAAKMLGISPSGVDNLVQRGAIQRAGRGKFNVADLEAYISVRDPDAQLGAQLGAPGSRGKSPKLTVIEGGSNEPPSLLVSNKIRKETALADKAEFELKIRRGEYVLASEVKQEAADVSRIMVARLSAFATRLGSMLAPITDTAECVQTIKSEVNLVIDEIRHGINELGEEKEAG